MSQDSTGIMFRTFLGIGLIGFGLLINANGQENRGSETEKDFSVRIGVDEVRLDAVVLDKTGHQVTDLTADDFEIYQDDKLQQIISSKHITNSHAQPQPKIIVSKETKKYSPIPTPPLTKDAVRRTIVFLIDDVSMNFSDFQNARMALRKFVEGQMQPGDLVALMQTRGWNASLQTLTSNKEDLLTRIGKLQWSNAARIEENDEDSGPKFKTVPIGISQALAIPYCIQAMQDMPGRKHLILLSTKIMLLGAQQGTKITALDRAREVKSYNDIADAALRAGIVIHTLDILGLFNNSVIQKTVEMPNGKLITLNARLDAETRSLDDKNGREFDGLFGDIAGDVLKQSGVRQENRRIPLSEKTGGIFLTGNNFFLNGIGDAEEAMQGYYLLSYIPPADTFQSDNSAAYHKIKIKVKRPGTEIHTRDGFYSAPGDLRAPAQDENPLLKAMFSPFRYNQLDLDLALGFIDDPESGYLLRAWL